MFQGFRKFVLRGNVVDLAVGVVMGVAFGALVTSIVKDLITPFLAALIRKPDFSAIAMEVNGSKLMVGNFLNALFAFLLISAAVYFCIVLPVNTLIAHARKAPPADPTTKKCPECLSEIPLEARRCAHCTSTFVSAQAA